jgi:hypothetical protein
MQLILEHIAAQAAEIAELKMVMDQTSGLLSGAMTVGKAQRQHIAELTAEIERLKIALQEAELKVSLIWPGTWQPVTEENTELIDPNADDDRRLYIDDEGAGIEFTCDSGELEGYFNLPERYAVCRKVQP